MIDMNPFHQAMSDLAARMSSNPAPAPQTSTERRAAATTGARRALSAIAQASTAALAETDPDEQAFAVDTLARERDRYRAALESIAANGSIATRAIARRALAQG